MNSYRTIRHAPHAAGGDVEYYSLPKLGNALGIALDRMPEISLKVLLENLVRHEDGVTVTAGDVAALARWPDPGGALEREVSFHPVRVLMPDSSGVPLLIDLRRHARCDGGAWP